MMKWELNKRGLSFKSLLLILLAIGLSIIIYFPIPILMAVDYKTEECLKSWRIEKGSVFYIEYTHSVQLTPVGEVYVIDDEYNICLKESYFHSYGAGLPATTPYKFEMKEGKFRIYGIDEKMDNLIYRTGAIRANHKIYIGNRNYSFLDFSKPRTGVKFTMGRLPLLKYIFKEGLN